MAFQNYVSILKVSRKSASVGAVSDLVVEVYSNLAHYRLTHQTIPRKSSLERNRLIK